MKRRIMIGGFIAATWVLAFAWLMQFKAVYHVGLNLREGLTGLAGLLTILFQF